MASSGCSFKDGFCLPVVEKCEGCDRTKEFEGKIYCNSYPDPEAKWDHGACNFATHVQAVVDKAGKVKINPLKASKRAARGR
nr:PxxKW family cysteine-rich protein [Desulfonatronovibrio hydrogenovorans]